jgi:hypothetical protein
VTVHGVAVPLDGGPDGRDITAAYPELGALAATAGRRTMVGSAVGPSPALGDQLNHCPSGSRHAQCGHREIPGLACPLCHAAGQVFPGAFTTARAQHYQRRRIARMVSGRTWPVSQRRCIWRTGLAMGIDIGGACAHGRRRPGSATLVAGALDATASWSDTGCAWRRGWER